MSDIKKKIKRRRQREEQAKRYRIALISAVIIGIIVLVLGSISVKYISNYIENKNLEQQMAEKAAEAEQTRLQQEEIVNAQKINAVKDTIESDFNDSTIVEMTDEQLLDKNIHGIIVDMTLEEKVYQLFIATPENIIGGVDVTAIEGTDSNKFKSHPVSGIYLTEANIKNKTQAESLISSVKKYSEDASKVPVFLCINEEGGGQATIAGNSAFAVKKYGSASDIQSLDDAQDAGEAIGEYLKEFGFNVNFAPCADVIMNEESSYVINRSFGTDPYGVSAMAKEIAHGMSNQGVIPTIKHFPGYGSVGVNEETGSLSIYKGIDGLREVDFIPFKEAIEDGAELIMVGNASAPNVTGDNEPCCTSAKIVDEILRNELGYQGVVITDRLDANSLTDNYDSASLCVASIKAGADLLLAPSDLEQGVAGIIQAVNEGTILEARIDESVYRILNLKSKLKEE